MDFSERRLGSEAIMRPWFRQKFQLSSIFKKMFRRGLVRPRFKQKFQLSGIFKISKKVRNTIFTYTKKTRVSRVSVLHFSSKYLKKKIHGVFTLQFINFGDAHQLVCFIILHSFSMKITQQVTP